MAAGTFTLYSSNKDDLNPNDLAGATVKVALVSSGYTPLTSGAGHDEWADVSGSEIATGNGYVAGGSALTDSVTVTGSAVRYDANDVTWTATGGNIPAWRYAVVYVAGSLWSKTSPLVGYFTGNTTGGGTDIAATTTGNNLTIQWNTDGLFKVS